MQWPPTTVQRSLFYRVMRRLIVVTSLLCVPAGASANGSYSHVHISQLAADGLPPGELASLLADPANRAALEAGSMFPDSGYAAEDEYGELAHWEPFLGAFIAQLRATHGADFSSPEAQRQVAFLLGVASHGMADQSYDTTLLERAYEVDGPEDDARPVDQYADYFIVIDHDAVFSVEPEAPWAEIVPAMDATGHAVNEAVLMNGMNRMAVVIDLQGNPRTSRSLYYDAWESYPFLGTHIYNVDAVGSLPWIAELVQAYWEVVYARLRAADDVDAQLVIRAVPEDGGTNWPVDLEETTAWGRPALYFGYGIDRDQLAPLLTLRDESTGEGVGFSIQTAYGGRDRNLVFLRPDAPLSYDTDYTIEVTAGVETLDGRTSAAPFMTSFRTRCAPDALDDCPPLEPPLVTGEIPRRPEPTDAGPPDAGAPEVDAGAPADEGGGCAVSPARRGAWLVGLLPWLLLFARRRRDLPPAAEGRAKAAASRPAGGRGSS